MTAVDDTILKLVEVFGDALPNWQVLDGWNGKTDLADSALIVSESPQFESPVAVSNIDPDDGGLDALVETITVPCVAARWDGNMDFRAKRADLATMLTSLRAALAADKKLGGFALDVWIEPTAQWFAVIQQNTNDSPAKANAYVEFSVTVEVHAP